jgi:predicted HicB family RNase H-like nuclease
MARVKKPKLSVEDTERAVSNTFSLPMRLHMKINEEAKKRGISRSRYLKELLEEIQ